MHILFRRLDVNIFFIVLVTDWQFEIGGSCLDLKVQAFLSPEVVLLISTKFVDILLQVDISELVFEEVSPGPSALAAGLG